MVSSIQTWTCQRFVRALLPPSRKCAQEYMVEGLTLLSSPSLLSRPMNEHLISPTFRSFCNLSCKRRLKIVHVLLWTHALLKSSQKDPLQSRCVLTNSRLPSASATGAEAFPSMWETRSGHTCIQLVAKRNLYMGTMEKVLRHLLAMGVVCLCHACTVAIWAVGCEWCRGLAMALMSTFGCHVSATSKSRLCQIEISQKESQLMTRLLIGNDFNATNSTLQSSRGCTCT
mmetsp:Transcript_127187/g.245289  ORF Transcript_127187/g.245289 Transcript_127187/m.245289 type:complete len:229 (-) Transcript_127187:13-699(-)